MRNWFLNSIRLNDKLLCNHLFKLNINLSRTSFILASQASSSPLLKSSHLLNNHFSSSHKHKSDFESEFKSSFKESNNLFDQIEEENKFLSQNFKTTEISIGQLPRIRIPTRWNNHKNRRKLKPEFKELCDSETMSLDNPGQAKWHLKNVFYLLRSNNPDDDEEQRKFKNSVNKYDVLTDFSYVGNQWSCQITIFYPNKQSFVASGPQKKDAEDNASLKTVNWLKEKGVINVDNKPILLEKQKLKKYVDSKRGILEPLNVKKLSSVQRKYLDDFIDIFELKYKSELENQIDVYLSNEMSRQTLHYEDTRHLRSFFSDTPEDFNTSSHELFNLISGRPLKKMTVRDRDRINSQLSTFLKRRDEGSSADFDQYFDYKRKIQNLPIHKYREELLDLIFDNQVVVISGETGCGKSTQIPQYILEDMIRGNCGADCSIIVTQPRRLPAISVSEQSALQFGEKSIGNSFGYHVRFEKELPIRDNGVVMFCTTGMLLRKMAGNPYLLGVSHLILDEVHEREFLADLTLILLKKILEKNDRIKVILMSASLNAETFSKYFKNCPIYRIPGRCYPVENIYLDQIERELRRPPQRANIKSSNDRRVDYSLVVELINYINDTKDDNDSILCFLPGWSDIKKIREDLEKRQSFRNTRSPTMSIIPVHSKLTSQEQKAIFKPIQTGVRKIILSTNITETSLTVPDVAYVVDCGLCNEIYYNKEYNVSTFGTYLISRANAKQRAGRAGRVKPGVCYKLYTSDTEQNQMMEYFLPEILRIPLESSVMISKLYCPDEKIDDFLSRALEPPSKTAIQCAVETLKLINVIDPKEHLTLIGRKIVDLSAHPRLSVCLMTAAMTGCFDQVLNITSLLSQAKDPFLMLTGNKVQIRTIKESISGNVLSDYYALNNLLRLYEKIKGFEVDQEARAFFKENSDFINQSTLEGARQVKQLLIKDLAENGIEEDLCDLSGQESLKSNCLFDLTLLSGLYPNVLKYFNEKNSQKFQLIDVNTGNQTNYTSESLLSSARIDDESYFTSIYFDSYYSEDRRKLMIKNASLIPSVYVLFASKNVKVVKEEGPLITFILDDCKFLIYTMDKQDLKLILKWKDIFNIYQQWFLCNDKTSSDSSRFLYMKKTFKEFLDLTNKVFDRYSKLD